MWCSGASWGELERRVRITGRLAGPAGRQWGALTCLPAGNPCRPPRSALLGLAARCSRPARFHAPSLSCSETWPFFRPNYKQMEQYRQEHGAEEASHVQTAARRAPHAMHRAVHDGRAAGHAERSAVLRCAQSEARRGGLPGRSSRCARTDRPCPTPAAGGGLCAHRLAVRDEAGDVCRQGWALFGPPVCALCPAGTGGADVGWVPPPLPVITRFPPTRPYPEAVTVRPTVPWRLPAPPPQCAPRAPAACTWCPTASTAPSPNCRSTCASCGPTRRVGPPLRRPRSSPVRCRENPARPRSWHHSMRCITSLIPSASTLSRRGLWFACGVRGSGRHDGAPCACHPRRP